MLLRRSCSSVKVDEWSGGEEGDEEEEEEEEEEEVIVVAALRPELPAFSSSPLLLLLFPLPFSSLSPRNEDAARTFLEARERWRWCCCCCCCCGRTRELLKGGGEEEEVEQEEEAAAPAALAVVAVEQPLFLTAHAATTIALLRRSRPACFGVLDSDPTRALVVGGSKKKAEKKRTLPGFFSLRRR